MPASVEKHTPAKINLLLNVLGRRQDGFHEVETVLYPVALYDTLRFTRTGQGIQFTCNDARLKNDPSNLVVRAATVFFAAAKIEPVVNIQLEKRIPIGAGLGGGSSNAAATLLALNELFGMPLQKAALEQMAVALGSDVAFFLQDKPALATGRGEQIQPVEPLRSLTCKCLFLVYPGFGISTAWAYQQLSRFPHALEGRPGRAMKLIELLQKTDLQTASAEFYNSLEVPVFQKYPILAIYKEFLRANGALAALMSGSGSTVFAIFDNIEVVKQLDERFKQKFGRACLTAILPL